VGLWWLSGVVVAQWGCGGSVGLWWLSGVVVAQWGCGGPVGLWWPSRYSAGQQIQTAYTAVPRSNPATLTVSLNGARKIDCVSKTNLGLGGVPIGV
jgi:hypothetical protein